MVFKTIKLYLTKARKGEYVPHEQPPLIYHVPQVAKFRCRGLGTCVEKIKNMIISAVFNLLSCVRY